MVEKKNHSMVQFSYDFRLKLLKCLIENVNFWCRAVHSGTCSHERAVLELAERCQGVVLGMFCHVKVVHARTCALHVRIRWSVGVNSHSPLC